MPSCRIPPIAYALLLIAGICIYGIILNPMTTFAGMDFQNLSYPRALQAKLAYQAGHIPLWNWNEWGGAPLLATALGSVLYPPTWLAMAFPLPYGLQLLVFFHLILAGIGAAKLSKALFEMPDYAAVTAGILYMGNSFYSGRIETFQIIAVNCLLPWLLLATVGVIRDGKSILPWIIIWAFHLLAGHPQYAVFNLITAAAFALIFIFTHPQGMGHLIRLTGALLLGSALAAVQLLPTYELAALSERIWPYPDPTAPELAWSNLPAIIIPRFYNIVTGETGRVFGFTELGLYSGMLALPLAIWVVTATARGRGERECRSIVVGVVAVLVVAMLFALGKQGFIADIVYNHAPFFKQSRGAARSLNIAALALALLAGLGAGRFAVTVGAQLKRTPVQISVALFCFCLADIAINQFPVLRSVVVPRSSIALPGLFSDQRLREASPAGRLYRFTGTDSDIYLNNAPQAVAERILRLQPNLASRPKVSQLDGYEEGLLPTRAHANFRRMLNRNFRDDAPDAALLALMGSNLMFTEFPLPPSAAWKAISEPAMRPSLVPSLTGGPAAYQLFSSDYRVNTLALDASTTTSHGTIAGIVDKFAKVIAATTIPVKIPPSRLRINLPTDDISAEDFARAQAIYINEKTGPAPNAFNFLANGPTTLTLLLFAPYPGWKPAAETHGSPGLSEISPVLYIHTISKSAAGQIQTIIFAPFSFRLGLFISLAALIALLCIALRSFTLRPLPAPLNTNPTEL